MGRENKNKAVASLHREQILRCTEALFLEKGYAQTSMEDISQAAGYSRRTIYAYYSSKSDILQGIVERGLQTLLTDLQQVLSTEETFSVRCLEMLNAMGRYLKCCPLSAAAVHTAAPLSAAQRSSSSAQQIFSLGEQLQTLLIQFLTEGQRLEQIKAEVIPALTVPILWSGVSGLYQLLESRGEYLASQRNTSTSALWEYGCRQLLGSVLIHLP